jgi:predicted enzyme related to lactoylglutathione lyase
MPRFVAVSLYAPDLAKVVPFYTEQLGFQVEEQHGDEQVQLAHEGLSVVLCKGPKAPEAAYPSGAVLGLAVDDVAKKLAQLKPHTKLIHDKPQPFPVGLFAAVRDPAGNVIELLQFKH